MKKYWRESDENNLIAMLASGKTNAQIARSLGRTVSSVQHKRSRMGLTDVRLRGAEQPEQETPEDVKQRLYDHLTETIDMLTNVKTELTEQRRLIGDAAASATVAIETADAAGDIAADALNLTEEHEQRLFAQRADLIDIEAYINHSWFWRLFHGYANYKRRIHAAEEGGAE